jgi:hypothetical protein
MRVERASHSVKKVIKGIHDWHLHKIQIGHCQSTITPKTGQTLFGQLQVVLPSQPQVLSPRERPKNVVYMIAPNRQAKPELDDFLYLLIAQGRVMPYCFTNCVSFFHLVPSGLC